MKQQEINFERFGRREQLDALDALQLPAYGGVSGATLKAVLRSIESHARGEGESWATQETIQREVNLKNIRTVKRAVAALVELNLITHERRCLGFSRWVNHHTIVWQQVVAAENRGQEVTFIGDKKSPSLVTSSTETGGEKSPSLVTRSHLHKKRNSKRKEPPPPNGAREEEEEEIFQEERPSMAAKRKPPAERPILEADYRDRPTEHRASPAEAGRLTPHAGPPVQRFESTPGNDAERELFDYRRGMPGWEADDQDRVRDMFAAAGVAMAHDLMRLAIARGMTPADCDTIVEQFHGSVEAKTRKPLGAGALVKRIEQSNWPCLLTSKADLNKPAAEPTPDLVELRRHAERRAANDKLTAEAKAARERMQERDDRLGKILDALPEAQLVALIARIPEAYRTGPIAGMWAAARPIKSCMVRQELFNLLESGAL